MDDIGYIFVSWEKDVREKARGANKHDTVVFGVPRDEVFGLDVPKKCQAWLQEHRPEDVKHVQAFLYTVAKYSEVVKHDDIIYLGVEPPAGTAPVKPRPTAAAPVVAESAQVKQHKKHLAMQTEESTWVYHKELYPKPVKMRLTEVANLVNEKPELEQTLKVSKDKQWVLATTILKKVFYAPEQF